MKYLRSLFRILGLVLLVTLLGSAGCLVAFEDRLIFFPDKYPSGDWDLERLAHLPGGENPLIEDSYFQTSDGVRLNGWFCTPRRPTTGGPVVLWFHGNAANLTDRYDMLRGFTALGATVFIIDYRGYGRSEGSPSEDGLYLDAQGAWDYLTKERGIPAERIVLFGKSLGGVPAIELATHTSPAGLIVQSSFTSIPDMAKAIFPFLPRFLVRVKMNSLSRIAQVGAPKLFIHSRSDEVVPFEFGRKLYDAAGPPKLFYEVPRARHNETYVAGGSAYWNAIGDFLAASVKGPSPALLSDSENLSQESPKRPD